MPHLDSVIIHNFKSFKHVNIKFSKGFNCIVGANGSGKSNICDSLLFALGESSLRRMRVPNASHLINSSAKPKKEDGVKKAYVKINFTGAKEGALEVARVIKSNNKMGYRLNGKHAAKQEVVDALHGYRSEINETNIIAQGEIQNMIGLNAKERRELIDVAAGIKEFNYKKDSAMKELEKVEAKINETQIALNERKGFLNQLEKEKEDAEKYLQLADSIKRTSYTLLKNSERQAEYDFNKVADMLEDNEQRRKIITSKISEIDLMVEKLSKDREAHSKSLNERSVELSSTNKILEDLKRSHAVKEEQIRSLKERIGTMEGQLTQLKDEHKKLKQESAEADKAIESSQKELESKSKDLSANEDMDHDTSQISRIGQNQKRIDELYAQSESLSKQCMQQKFEMDDAGKLAADNLASIESRSAELESTIEGIKASKAALEKAVQRAAELEKSINESGAKIQLLQKSIDEIYVESVNVREQISSLGGGSDRIKDALKKGMRSGFHGRAYELCTYEDKYALAINSAAASRLGYLVVDSAEDADSAIRTLKDRQLGRASFIPINDIVANNRGDNTKLDRLIDHVKFDDMFESVFRYIFANTYVVESIAEAKSIGLGKYRFVTIDGELIEQSGVITGGSAKSLQSPRMLESRLNALDARGSSAREAYAKAGSETERIRKELATSQSDIMGSKVELRHLEARQKSLASEIEALKSTASGIHARLGLLKKSYGETDSRMSLLVSELSKLKAENEGIYSLNDAPHHKSKPKTETERLKSLRSDVEQLKIKMATLSKERELKGARANEMESAIKSSSGECADARKKIAIVDSELMKLSESVKEIHERIGKSDASSQELYGKMQDLDSKISRLSADKGSSQLELEGASRSAIEQETRKVQLQTRISDIKAELVSYKDVSVIEALTAEELEARKAIAKSDMERLGAVNLKAPEVYLQKKKDVDEVNSKMATLSSEKDSIMAMINEIESKKLNIFMETFGEVDRKFQDLYGYIFEGSASLQLENNKDPFNSGLLIRIKSPKNTNSAVETLSGGEKSLVIIMLIFAIQAHNPMSVYLFDEIDASLDKENSKKLSRLMKEMSKSSQLIVISHNDSLISAADTAIGVVHRNGESRVVGLELTPMQSADKK
ncbi:MAG: AAA family ATPase [Candidatus Micrarchaeaceae archaeon]